MLKDSILHELEADRTHAISGQALAKKYNVSRNSVWKAVNSLKKDGYNIFSSTNKGYMLAVDNDIISEQGISLCLKSTFQNIPIYIFQNVDSTNNEAKRMIAGNGDIECALIVSEEQEKGHGRNAGEFFSPAKTGIYMSLIYKVSKVISKPKVISMKAALAVIRAVEKITGVQLSVSNINDICYKGRKAGGILTEAVTGLETGVTSHIIVGIGINVSTDSFPEGLAEKAAALKELDIRRNELIAEIINEIIPLYEHLEDESFMDEYNRMHTDL